MSKNFVSEIKGWVIALAIAIILAFLIRNFVISPVYVDGDSMEPTLHNKSRMILNKIGYRLGDLKRGDIVVFHATGEKDFIKRVIGLPGDSVEFKDDVLYINGKAVEEPYLDEYKKKTTDGLFTYDFSLEKSFGLTKIPEGEYFLVGDNRRVSGDSRLLGPIKEDQIIGKANFVFWPLSEMKMAK